MQKVKYAFFFLSIFFFSLNFYLLRKEEYKQINLVESYIDDMNEGEMALVISKINLKTMVSLDYNLDKVSIFSENKNPSLSKKLILIAHNGNSYKSYFRRINEIVLGDNITLYYFNVKYDYIAIDIFSLSKTDVSILNENCGNDLILITCLDKPGERYAVVASLVKKTLIER